MEDPDGKKICLSVTGRANSSENSVFMMVDLRTGRKPSLQSSPNTSQITSFINFRAKASEISDRYGTLMFHNYP